jgi:hypothetical protein
MVILLREPLTKYRIAFSNALYAKAMPVRTPDYSIYGVAEDYLSLSCRHFSPQQWGISLTRAGRLFRRTRYFEGEEEGTAFGNSFASLIGRLSKVRDLKRGLKGRIPPFNSSAAA